jgi:hypothetical protein
MHLTLATEQVGQLVGKLLKFSHFGDYYKTIVARHRIIHMNKPISFTVGGGTDENG